MENVIKGLRDIWDNRVNVVAASWALAKRLEMNGEMSEADRAYLKSLADECRETADELTSLVAQLG